MSTATITSEAVNVDAPSQPTPNSHHGHHGHHGHHLTFDVVTANAIAYNRSEEFCQAFSSGREIPPITRGTIARITGSPQCMMFGIETLTSFGVATELAGPFLYSDLPVIMRSPFISDVECLKIIDNIIANDKRRRVLAGEQDVQQDQVESYTSFNDEDDFDTKAKKMLANMTEGHHVIAGRYFSPAFDVSFETYPGFYKGTRSPKRFDQYETYNKINELLEGCERAYREGSRSYIDELASIEQLIYYKPFKLCDLSDQMFDSLRSKVYCAGQASGRGAGRAVIRMFNHCEHKRDERAKIAKMAQRVRYLRRNKNCQHVETAEEAEEAEYVRRFRRGPENEIDALLRTEYNGPCQCKISSERYVHSFGIGPNHEWFNTAVATRTYLCLRKKMVIAAWRVLRHRNIIVGGILDIVFEFTIAEYEMVPLFIKYLKSAY